MQRVDQLLALSLCGALVFVSITAGTVALNAPEAPRSLPATQLSATSTGQHVILRWDARTEYTQWEYRQWPASGQYGGWEAVAADAESNTQVIAGLAGGQAYYFQVRGIGGNGRGPPSNAAVAVTEAKPAPPPPDCCGDIVGDLNEIKAAVETLSTHFVTTFPDSLKPIQDSLKAIEKELKRLSGPPIESDPTKPLVLIMGDLELTKIVIDGQNGYGEPSCKGKQAELGELYFSNDSDLLVKEPKEEDSDLLKSNPGTLAKIGEDLENRCFCGLVIFEGHASEPGPPSYNLDLAQRRSQAVKDYLWQERPDAKCPRAAVVTAAGERHDEAIPQRDENLDRRVRVLWRPWEGGAKVDCEGAGTRSINAPLT